MTTNRQLSLSLGESIDEQDEVISAQDEGLSKIDAVEMALAKAIHGKWERTGIVDLADLIDAFRALREVKF